MILIFRRRFILSKFNFSIRNEDGTINGKLLAGLISLFIVLIQQIFNMFGVKFTGDWVSIVSVINTILTILGLVGVVSNVEPINAPVATIEEGATTTSSKPKDTETTTVTESETVTEKVATVTETETVTKQDDNTDEQSK